MNISFLDNWRKRYGNARGTAVLGGGEHSAEATAEGVGDLLGECELLRVQAGSAGVELDDSPASLEALDQLLPRWRDDPEVAPWLGNDAGLYLGTVIVRTVRGAKWRVWPDGTPVVELASGREVDAVEVGATWALTGSPELSQIYAEVAES